MTHKYAVNVKRYIMSSAVAASKILRRVLKILDNIAPVSGYKSYKAPGDAFLSGAFPVGNIGLDKLGKVSKLLGQFLVTNDPSPPDGVVTLGPRGPRLVGPQESQYGGNPLDFYGTDKYGYSNLTREDLDDPSLKTLLKDPINNRWAKIYTSGGLSGRETVEEIVEVPINATNETAVQLARLQYLKELNDTPLDYPPGFVPTIDLLVGTPAWFQAPQTGIRTGQNVEGIPGLIYKKGPYELGVTLDGTQCNAGGAPGTRQGNDCIPNAIVNDHSQNIPGWFQTNTQPQWKQDWVRAGGRVDQNGNPIDSQGVALQLDSEGNIVGPSGNVVTPSSSQQYQIQEAPTQMPPIQPPTQPPANAYTPAQKWYMAGGATDENGNPIDMNGGPVTFDREGNAIDQNGNHVTIKGAPIFPSAPPYPSNNTGVQNQNNQPPIYTQYAEVRPPAATGNTPATATGNTPMQVGDGSAPKKRCREMKQMTIQFPKKSKLTTPLVLQAAQAESTQPCAENTQPFQQWAKDVQQWKDPTHVENLDDLGYKACNLQAQERHKECKEIAKKFQYDMRQAGCPGTTCKLPSFTRVCTKRSSCTKKSSTAKKNNDRKAPAKRASVKKAPRPNTYTKRGGINSITTAADLQRFLKDNNLKPHQFNAMPWLKANNERMYGNKGKVITYKRGGREYGIL